MKIVIATRFFYPEVTPRAFRSYELAKGLSRLGHEVTVVTTQRDHNYSDLTAETGVKVDAAIRPEPTFFSGRGLASRAARFIMGYAFLYPYSSLVKGFSNYFKREGRCDLLISIAYPYPVHFGIARARRNNPKICRVWVADCGDPFTGNREGRLPMPFYFKAVERWFLRTPDFITVPVEEAVDAYCEGFQHKFRVIPQGFDFSGFIPSSNEPRNSVPTFAYAGNLSTGARDPRPLLDFLRGTGVEFKFIVYTKNSGFLEPYISTMGDMFEVRSYVPREELLRQLSEMDFLVNFENRGGAQKPSKLIDYALVNKPVLSISQGKIEEAVVAEFLKGNYEHALDLGDLSAYDINNVVTAFLALG